MMVIIILFNNKDYNNKTPPPPRKNCISQRASMERNEISQGELFFFKLWNGMSRGFQSGETCY